MSNTKKKTARKPVDVSTSKRRFALDSFLARHQSRRYELPIMGEVYDVAPELPLLLQIEMQEFAAAHDDTFSNELIGRFFDAALGEGVYQALLEKGITKTVRDDVFTFLNAIYSGVEIADEFLEVADGESEDASEDGGDSPEA